MQMIKVAYKFQSIRSKQIDSYHTVKKMKKAYNSLICGLKFYYLALLDVTALAASELVFCWAVFDSVLPESEASFIPEDELPAAIVPLKW